MSGTRSTPAIPSRSTTRLRPPASTPRKSSSGATPGSTTSCRASSKDGTIAVLALGRKDTDEPFNSEDLALLTAVAGQVATAIENGRLYRQLHLKAEELGRMREFNENILESLDDGLVVFDADERIVRWNRALEEFYGVRARGRDRPRAGRRVRPRRSSRRCAAARRSIPRAPRSTACRSTDAGDEPTRHACSSTRPPCRCSDVGDDAVVGHDLADRGHHRPRAARRAAADFREDGVDRAAGGRRGARGQHAADRHLELHADAARRRRPGRSDDTVLLEKIERQTFRAAKIVNGLLNLSRPGTHGRRAAAGRSQRRHHRRVLAARAPVRGRQHQGAARAGGRRRCGARASSTSCSRCS